MILGFFTHCIRRFLSFSPMLIEHIFFLRSSTYFFYSLSLYILVPPFLLLSCWFCLYSCHYCRKNNPDFEQSPGVSIVVGLDAHIYNREGKTYFSLDALLFVQFKWYKFEAATVSSAFNFNWCYYYPWPVLASMPVHGMQECTIQGTCIFFFYYWNYIPFLQHRIDLCLVQNFGLLSVPVLHGIYSAQG